MFNLKKGLLQFLPTLKDGVSLQGLYEIKDGKLVIGEKKPDLLQQLKDYFVNTPREIIEKEWHEYDKYNEIEPTVNEYLEYLTYSHD